MSRELEELKEMKAICFELIERIKMLEEANHERRRQWCVEMNKRLAALGLGGSSVSEEEPAEKYAKMLQARKKKQLKQGEEDAAAGKSPITDELAYIQGYERGLSRRKND